MKKYLLFLSCILLVGLQVLFSVFNLVALYTYSYRFVQGGLFGQINAIVMLLLVVLLQAFPLTAISLLLRQRIFFAFPVVSQLLFVIAWTLSNAITAYYFFYYFSPIGNVPIAKTLSNGYFIFSWILGNIFYAGAQYAEKLWGKRFIFYFTLLASFYLLALSVPTIIEYYNVRNEYISERNWTNYERSNLKQWNSMMQQLHRQLNNAPRTP